MSKIEQHVARLVPFDFYNSPSSGGPLAPIYATGGLIFQYTPTITEAIQVNYSTSGDLPHTNEQYNVFKNRANRTIDLGNVVFTADTYANAKYALAAIHFFRTYSMMDFGKNGTGRPPSPMWFSALGEFMYDRVPVLLSGASFNFDGTSHDLVQLAKNTSSVKSNVLEEPGAARAGDLANQFLPTGELPDIRQVRDVGEDIGGTNAWIPAKVEISNVRLTVQHSPKYWKEEFSLEDFKSGSLINKSEPATVYESGISAVKSVVSGVVVPSVKKLTSKRANSAGKTGGSFPLNRI